MKRCEINLNIISSYQTNLKVNLSHTKSMHNRHCTRLNLDNLFTSHRTHNGPITVIRNATKYDVMPIQTTHIAKVNTRKRGNRRQSGMLSHNRIVIGHRSMNPQQLVSDDLVQGLSALSSKTNSF